MAQKKITGENEKPQFEEVEVPVEKERIKLTDSVYTAKELADNHKAFGTYREIVEVALKQAKKQEATFNEAKRIIESFKNKGVK